VEPDTVNAIEKVHTETNDRCQKQGESDQLDVGADKPERDAPIAINPIHAGGFSAPR